MSLRNQLARLFFSSSLCVVVGTLACSKPETPAQPAPSTVARRSGCCLGARCRTRCRAGKLRKCNCQRAIQWRPEPSV